MNANINRYEHGYRNAMGRTNTDRAEVGHAIVAGQRVSFRRSGVVAVVVEDVGEVRFGTFAEAAAFAQGCV